MEIFIDLLIGIAMTAIAYLICPLIGLLINQGKFNKKQAKRFALWNSIIIGGVFCVLTIDSGAAWSGGAAFLYYWINRGILSNGEDEADQKDKITDSLEEKDGDIKGEASAHVNAASELSDIAFKDIAFVRDDEKSQNILNSLFDENKPTDRENITDENTSDKEVKKVEKKRFCSCCGSVIDNNIKKCTGCGKQYFKLSKIFNKRTVFPIVLSILLTVSIVMNIVQAIKVRDYKGYWLYCLEKCEFYEEAVVFIADDGTNLYHKYYCSNFDEGTYWAHNVAYAEWLGYSPCSWCCD